jgi:hypothetical protein
MQQLFYGMTVSYKNVTKCIVVSEYMVKFRGTTFIAKCHAKGQKLKLDKMKV